MWELPIVGSKTKHLEEKVGGELCKPGNGF